MCTCMACACVWKQIWENLKNFSLRKRDSLDPGERDVISASTHDSHTFLNPLKFWAKRHKTHEVVWAGWELVSSSHSGQTLQIPDKLSYEERDNLSQGQHLDWQMTIPPLWLAWRSVQSQGFTALYGHTVYFTDAYEPVCKWASSASWTSSCYRQNKIFPALQLLLNFWKHIPWSQTLRLMYKVEIK